MTFVRELMATVYGLIDPRTGKLRCVGCTMGQPAIRLTVTLALARSGRLTSPQAAWLLELDASWLRPQVVVIEECPIADRFERERLWIARFRQRFPERMLNVQAGTRGAP